MKFLEYLPKFKFLNNLKFFVNYMISGFANGGSWKLDRIVELDNRETRKIMIRHMSTYEELFSWQERAQH
jgi:hypothetical protein